MEKLTIVCCVLLISCGSSSSKTAAPPSVDNACSSAAAAPCGGNIVGTWKFVGVCDRAMSQRDIIDKYGGSGAACAVSGDVPITGYARFRDDGTYQIDEDDTVVLGFTEGCLQSHGKTCAELSAKAAQLDAGEGIGVSCAQSDSLCMCSVSLGGTADLGGYTLSATSYHLASSSRRTTDRDYCVQGDVLSVFAPANTIGGAGTAVLVRIPDATVADIDASTPDAKADAGRGDSLVDKTSHADASVEKAKNDSGADVSATDSRAFDASAVDAQPVDATPIPLGAMPPSTASACAIAASAPCGGDVSGTWKIAGVCDPWLSATEYDSTLVECATHGDEPIAGTSSFNSDGTCSVHQTTTSEGDFSVSCLAKAGDTCSDRNQRYRNAIGTKGRIASSCVLTSSETCHCMEVYEFPAAGDACTYTTRGNELEFVSPPDAFQAGGYDYCVRGNVLSIFVAPTSATGLACDDCMAAFVLTRQN